jgi:hypothetical protein
LCGGKWSSHAAAAYVQLHFAPNQKIKKWCKENQKKGIAISGNPRMHATTGNKRRSQRVIVAAARIVAAA